MQVKLSQAFDECLARIKRGEAVKACLAEYRHMLQQLVPLLHYLTHYCGYQTYC